MILTVPTDSLKESRRKEKADFIQKARGMAIEFLLFSLMGVFRTR